MRGKKSDPIFVSAFISQCVQQGIITPEQIAEAARREIDDIDQQIKQVEVLKVTRSKLLDVIATFDKPASKEEEAKLLTFFELQYPALCQFICSYLSTKTLPISAIGDDNTNDDLKFCYKQLLGHKIIARVGDQLVRGDRYNEYMTFVLREATK